MAKILVVEDEPLIRMNLADALRDCGFEVEEAADAAAAQRLSIGAAVPFDGVIVDIGLPDQPGDVLARAMRTHWPKLPIIIATGHDPVPIGVAFAGDAWLRVIRKPYHPDAPLHALAELGVKPPVAAAST